MDVVTLGEALVGFDSCGRRLEAAHTLEKSVGGAESNLAIGLARLGHRTAFIGRVGDDPLGVEIERTLRGERVDVAHLVRDPQRPTGLMLKERRNGSSVSVHYYRAGAAGSALDIDDVPTRTVERTRILHVTGITLALGDGPRRAVRHAMQLAQDAGVTVSLDANFRYKLGAPEQLVAQFEDVVKLADHVLLSWNDAATCAGSREPDEVRAYARELDRPVVVLKAPRGGATAFENHEVTADQDPCLTDVVDPVGAGDAFAVGYLHGLLEGAGVAARLALGAWVTAQVIAQPGDYQGLPSRVELESATRDDESAVTR